MQAPIATQAPFGPPPQRHADLLAALLPPVSYDPTGPILAAQLATEGATLDAAQASAERIIAPAPDAPWLFGHPDLLPAWETLYQITPPADSTIAARQAQILARITAKGGLSLPYLTASLRAAGHDVVLDEPREFRAGTSRAGDQVYALGAVDYYFRVRARNISPAQVATLTAWLQDLQPAGAHFTLEAINAAN